MKVVVILLAVSVFHFANSMTVEARKSNVGRKEASDTSCEDAPLLQAVRMHNAVLVMDLARKGADLYAEDCEGRTPLHLACLFPDGEMIMALVRSRVDVNRRFRDGNTVLMYAAVEGTLEAIEALYNAGAELDSLNEEGNTALYQAALSERRDAVKLMIKLGSNINRRFANGYSYLHKAASADIYNLVVLFTELGTQIDSVNYASETPLLISVNNDNPAIISYLSHKGANIFRTFSNSNTYLHKAVQENKTEALRALCENDLSNQVLVDAINNNDETAMTISIRTDGLTTCAILAENKADLKKLTLYGKTYGQIAIASKALQSATCLRNHGYSEPGIDDMDTNGFNAIYYAVMNDDFETADILLELGANLTQANYTPSHESLIYKAAANGNTEATKWLIDKGLNINITDPSGYTTLHIACDFGHLPEVQLLVKLGACINYRDHANKTPLGCATLSDHLDVAEYLKSVGGIL